MNQLIISGKSYTLEEGETSIGREADICVESGQMSRRHACFYVSGNVLEIEDLGSTNGTFVNGQKVEARRRLKPGDKLLFGMFEVGLKLAPAAAPRRAGSSRRASAVSSKRSSRQSQGRPGTAGNRAIFKNVMIGGSIVLILVVILGYVASGSGKRADKDRAQHLLMKGQTVVDGARVADTMEDNRALYAQLSTLKTKLQKEVSPAWKEEHAQAREMLVKIDELLGRISATSVSIEKTTTADAELEEVTRGVADGSMNARDGLRRLRKLKKQYPGTPAAAQAAQAETGLLERVREEEQTGLMQLHEEVIALAEAGKFKDADAKVQAAFNKKYMILLEKDLETQLDKTMTQVLNMAGEHFTKATDPLVDKARGGNGAAIKAQVKQIYDEMGNLEGLNELYQRTLKQIEARAAGRLE